MFCHYINKTFSWKFLWEFWSTSKKKFCSKLDAIFKIVKVNFGSKFEAWVSFHTAILQSWKFQENLGRIVVVLPFILDWNPWESLRFSKNSLNFSRYNTTEFFQNWLNFSEFSLNLGLWQIQITSVVIDTESCLRKCKRISSPRVNIG